MSGERGAGAGTCGVKGGTNVGLHASLESCLRRAKEKKKRNTLLKNPENMKECPKTPEGSSDIEILFTGVEISALTLHLPVV